MNQLLLWTILGLAFGFLIVIGLLLFYVFRMTHYLKQLKSGVLLNEKERYERLGQRATKRFRSADREQGRTNDRGATVDNEGQGSSEGRGSIQAVSTSESREDSETVELHKPMSL